MFNFPELYTLPEAGKLCPAGYWETGKEQANANCKQA
jgi:hypothetical protein